MPASSDTEIVSTLAERHNIPEDAVRSLLDALRRSGGGMAQFNHPALGGFGQWSSGMIMIGDMFNDRLKATVAALAADLAAYVRAEPPQASAAQTEVSYRSSESNTTTWWPAELGAPASAGSQNGMRYAIFPSKQRLAIDDNGQIMLFDTADHLISGVGQAQGGGSTLTFTSQHGTVRVGDLKKIA